MQGAGLTSMPAGHAAVAARPQEAALGSQALQIRLCTAHLKVSCRQPCHRGPVVQHWSHRPHQHLQQGGGDTDEACQTICPLM